MTPAIPLPGPLDHDPSAEVTADLACAQLDAGLNRIALGDYDRSIAAWVAGWDASVIAAVASWLRRSYEVGITDGYRERLDEHPVIARLTARLDELERQVQGGA